MKIRFASPADVDDLYALALETPEFLMSARGAFMFKKEFVSLVRSPRCVVLVAERRGRVAGFVIGRRKAIHIGGIILLMVRKRERGGGVGSRLVKEVQRELKRRGAEYVELYVRADHPESTVFWKRMGFQPGYLFWFMEKRL